MSFAGVYKRISHNGAKEFLMNEGMTPENAEHTATMDMSIEFKVDGDKITRIVTAENIHEVDEFVLGQQFQEVLGTTTLRTIPTLNGSTLILSSKLLDGSEGWSRYHYFRDDGLEVLHKASHGEARMIFKKL